MSEGGEVAVSTVSTRRRSTFFEKRESLLPTQSERIERGDRVDFETYLNKLKREFQAWKKLYKNRKEKRREIDEKLKRFEDENVAIVNENSSCPFLSKNIIEFLEDGPDIDTIIRDSLDLCEEFAITEALYMKLVEDNSRITEYVKNTINKTTKRIYDDDVFTKNHFIHFDVTLT